MFTGIIEETGVIKNIKRGGDFFIISIEAKKVLENTAIGDSIAVNGTCLTVVKLYPWGFDADVMQETLSRSVLKEAKSGERVNLERAVALGGRLGGHIVSGHIDGVGQITSIKKESNAVWITIQANSEILKYIVMKGSVALDGISLTVAKTDDISFSVSVIPHTISETTLYNKKEGNIVNIECDIIGKYVEKLISYDFKETAEKGITIELLSKNGFI